MMMIFLKGFLHLHPLVGEPVPLWGLDMVLTALMRPPFEPLASCPLPLLSEKTAFLIAITIARRLGELQALMVWPPYTQFSRDKVML